MKKKPLKIGIDASNLRRGGGITHILEILNATDPSESNIDKIIIFGNKNLLESIPNKTWLIKVNPPETEKNIFSRVVWQYSKLPKILEQYNCDILFSPGGSTFGGKTPVVTMSRNMLPFELSELKRYHWRSLALKLLILRFVQSTSFKRADGIIFLTDYAKRRILKKIGPLRADVATIPHGVSQRFRIPPRTQKKISHYNEKNPFLALYVSIVDQYKHQWNVVKAISILRNEGLPVKIDFIGPSYPPALKKLQNEILKLDPSKKWATYHGAVPFEKLHAHYAKADIGVFASSCENMPNILLETMAAGLPIACSERGPMPEILREYGVYFNPEDPHSIANCLRELIHSAQLRQDLSIASYKRSQDFSWQQCSYETFKFINKVSNSTKK